MLFAQVVFTSGTTTQITTGTNLIVNGLHLQNNAGSTLNHNGTINLVGNAVGRDLVNDGIFNGNSGTLRMSGSTEQQIQGIQVVNVGTFEVNNGAGNGVSVLNTGSLRIHSELLLTNGRLFTAEASPIRFATTALNPTETNANHIRGTAIMEGRAVNATAFATFLHFSMASGGDVGTLELTRRSGDGSASSRGFVPSQGFVNIGTLESIDAHWQVDISNTGAGIRDISISWLSDWDNGKNLMQMQFWRTESPFTIANPWILVNGGLLDLSARSHTESNLTLSTLRNAFTVSDLANPLPVSLLSFEVKLREGKDVEATWRSQNEQNLIYYELQRSFDNQNFETIHTEKAKNLANNVYQYSDMNAKGLGRNILYYRLVGVEAGGARRATPAQSVQFDKAFYVGVYPNPFREELWVKLYNPSEKSVQIELLDNLGRTLVLKTLEGERIEWDLSEHTKPLAAGAYILKISQASAVEFVKIVKQ